MFVSSYSTYIDTTATSKVNSERRELNKKSSDSFSSKLLTTTPKTLSTAKQLPVDYISDYKALYNRQKLDQEKDFGKKVATMKFSKMSSQSAAQVVYTANSTMFSLIPKPKVALDQTPSLSKKLPPQAQEAGKELLKIDMVNAYIANDNYYRITAA